MSADNPALRFEFVPHGATLAPRPGVVVVDVGSRCEAGVIDHHLDDIRDECAASLVFRMPELVLDHLRASPPGPVTVVTHREPDLDGVTAAWFVRSLVRTGRLPARGHEIASYTRDVDAGRCRLDLPLADQVHGIFLAAAALARREAAGSDRSEDERFTAVVERGMALLDYVAARLEDGAAIRAPGLFAPNHPFAAERAFLEDDYARYEGDVARGAMFTLAVPRSDGRGLRPVDGLRVRNPTSVGFRHYARADTVHAPSHTGFWLTHVLYGPEDTDHAPRHVIAVDPERDVCLAGLGMALEWNEVVKREVAGHVRPGPARWDDVANNDPWYDGRSPLHRYTIVDAPREGTLLTPAEVVDTLLASDQWSTLLAPPPEEVRLLCPRGCVHRGRLVHCPEHGERLAPERVAERYTLDRAIQRGAFGAVWRATDDETGAHCAVKLLLAPAKAANDVLERFRREARLGERVRHPNVVHVSDWGTCPVGGPYLAMELVDGTPLSRLTKAWWAGDRGPFPIGRAVRIVRQACDGIQALHERGWLHRDLKPSNLMVLTGADDHVKVVDLGLAIPMDPDATRLTGLGGWAGTPYYMAPERYEADARRGAPGGDLVPASDVYSLGLVLFELLTGRLPFGERLAPTAGHPDNAADLVELLQLRSATTAPSVASLRPDVPPALAAIVEACLAREIARRVPTPRTLAERLAPFAAD